MFTIAGTVVALHHDFEIAIRVVFRLRPDPKRPEDCFEVQCAVQSDKVTSVALLTNTDFRFRKIYCFSSFSRLSFKSCVSYIAFSACLIEAICIWPGQGLFHGVSAG